MKDIFKEQNKISFELSNHQEINGPNQFPLHQGLNQQIWNGFWNPNTVHVPKGVDARNF